jgi:hypothetical protein
MRAEEYTERQQEIDGWRVHIVSYRIRDRYYCTIDNVDPGARFARAQGPTLREAEDLALQKARKHLAQTRRFPSSWVIG